MYVGLLSFFFFYLPLFCAAVVLDQSVLFWLLFTTLTAERKRTESRQLLKQALKIHLYELLKIQNPLRTQRLANL